MDDTGRLTPKDLENFDTYFQSPEVTGLAQEFYKNLSTQGRQSQFQHLFPSILEKRLKEDPKFPRLPSTVWDQTGVAVPEGLMRDLYRQAPIPEWWRRTTEPLLGPVTDADRAEMGTDNPNVYDPLGLFTRLGKLGKEIRNPNELIGNPTAAVVAPLELGVLGPVPAVATLWADRAYNQFKGKDVNAETVKAGLDNLGWYAFDAALFAPISKIARGVARTAGPTTRRFMNKVMPGTMAAAEYTHGVTSLVNLAVDEATGRMMTRLNPAKIMNIMRDPKNDQVMEWMLSDIQSNLRPRVEYPYTGMSPNLDERLLNQSYKDAAGTAPITTTASIALMPQRNVARLLEAVEKLKGQDLTQVRKNPLYQQAVKEAQTAIQNQSAQIQANLLKKGKPLNATNAFNEHAKMMEAEGWPAYSFEDLYKIDLPTWLKKSFDKVGLEGAADWLREKVPGTASMFTHEKRAMEDFYRSMLKQGIPLATSETNFYDAARAYHSISQQAGDIVMKELDDRGITEGLSAIGLHYGFSPAYTLHLFGEALKVFNSDVRNRVLSDVADRGLIRGKDYYGGLSPQRRGEIMTLLGKHDKLETYFKALYKQVTDMRGEGFLNRMVDSGLIKPEKAEAWLRKWGAGGYLPVKGRTAVDDEIFEEMARDFGISERQLVEALGQESAYYSQMTKMGKALNDQGTSAVDTPSKQRAVGSQVEPINPFLQTISDRIAWEVAAEKNRVQQEVFRMTQLLPGHPRLTKTRRFGAELAPKPKNAPKDYQPEVLHPSNGLWYSYKPQDVVDKVYKELGNKAAEEYLIAQGWKATSSRGWYRPLQANESAVYINGERHHIVAGKGFQPVMRALKNADRVTMDSIINSTKNGQGIWQNVVSKVLRAQSAANRYYVKNSTQRSMIFGGTNSIRDFEGMIIEVDARLGTKEAKLFAKNTLQSALPALLQQYFPKAFKATAKWMDHLDRFAKSGAKITFANEIRGVPNMYKQLKGILRHNMGNWTRQAYDTLGNILDGYVSFGEQLTKAGLFGTLKDLGFDERKAAMLTQTIGLNFYKGGSHKYISDLYAFIRPNITGAAKNVDLLLHSPRYRQICGSITMATFAHAEFMRLIAGTDENGVNLMDKIDPAMLDSRMFLASPGNIMALPAPYQVSPFITLGYLLSAALHSEESGMSSGPFIASMMKACLNSVSPVSQMNSWQDIVLPTTGANLTKLWMGQNRWGNPINPKNPLKELHSEKGAELTVESGTREIQGPMPSYTAWPGQVPPVAAHALSSAMESVLGQNAPTPNFIEEVLKNTLFFPRLVGEVMGTTRHAIYSARGYDEKISRPQDSVFGKFTFNTDSATIRQYYTLSAKAQAAYQDYILKKNLGEKVDQKVEKLAALNRKFREAGMDISKANREIKLIVAGKYGGELSDEGSAQIIKMTGAIRKRMNAIIREGRKIMGQPVPEPEETRATEPAPKKGAEPTAISKPSAPPERKIPLPSSPRGRIERPTISRPQFNR